VSSLFHSSDNPQHLQGARRRTQCRIVRDCCRQAFMALVAALVVVEAAAAVVA
jgi:hypothetical protein